MSDKIRNVAILVIAVVSILCLAQLFSINSHLSSIDSDMHQLNGRVQEITHQKMR